MPVGLIGIIGDALQLSSVGHDDDIGFQAERVAQLVVQHPALILHLAQSQFQRLHLQLIARDIIAQSQSLVKLCLYVGDELLCQRDVLVIYRRRIRQLH